MAKAYKNFWSLNTDEAIVTGILKDSIGKKRCEILMPLNAQMKDVDLVLMNVETRKTLTVQVKGSRAYEPKNSEVAKYGDGSTGWFFLKNDTIDKATSDYFIFLTYVICQIPSNGRRVLEPHIISIPTDELKAFTRRYKSLHGGRYSYYFWVNPAKKVAFDFRDQYYAVSEYLDKKGLEKMSVHLQVAQ